MKISEVVRSTLSIFLFGNSAYKKPELEFLILGAATIKPETLIAEDGRVPVATLVTFVTASIVILWAVGVTVFTLL